MTCRIWKEGENVLLPSSIRVKYNFFKSEHKEIGLEPLTQLNKMKSQSLYLLLILLNVESMEQKILLVLKAMFLY